jgi:hypothetical protein
MVDHSDIPDIDPSQEEYSGPSAAIIALGRGVVQHLVWAFYGLMGGALIGAIAKTHSSRFIEAARDLSVHNLTEEKGFWNVVKNETASFGLKVFGEGKHITPSQLSAVEPRHKEWIHDLAVSKQNGFGHWLLAHTFGIIPFLERPTGRFLEWSNSNERLRNALTLGGFFGAGGYLAGWAEAFVHGARHGNDSREKYTQLQQMVRDSRSEIETLRRENTRLKTQQPMTQQRDDLHVANDKPTIATDDHGTAQHHPEKREPIKTPEQDWASDIAAQKEAAAQQEAVLG